jgi:RNase H-like domain found in reverse transcriptase
MSTDARDYCISGCNIQTKPNFNYNDEKNLTPNNYEHIGFFSKILNKTQREFNTIDKEMYSIVYILNFFRNIFTSNNNKLIILTNN